MSECFMGRPHSAVDVGHCGSRNFGPDLTGVRVVAVKPTAGFGFDRMATYVHLESCRHLRIPFKDE
jgi:hypothetical protein